MRPCFLFCQSAFSVSSTQFCDELDRHLVNKNYKVVTHPQRKCTLQGSICVLGNWWNKLLCGLVQRKWIKVLCNPRVGHCLNTWVPHITASDEHVTCSTSLVVTHRHTQKSFKNILNRLRNISLEGHLILSSIRKQLLFKITSINAELRSWNASANNTKIKHFDFHDFTMFQIKFSPAILDIL